MDELFVSEMKNACSLFPGSTFVVGRGSHTPKVVFVGEAPGAREDELGLPFVGASGKLLDEWIEHLGLSSDDYYITNVVKNRPPNNRRPTKAEVALCLPWLYKQLDLLEPKVVVLLGSSAMQAFFPDKKKLFENVGQLFDDRFVVLPHPSFFIRRGKKGWQEYVDSLKRFI